MSKSRKDLSCLEEDPNEFQIAEDTIKKIRDKEKEDDIDPYTAEKRVQKIMGAIATHRDCLEDKTREKDCHDSYFNLFKALKNMTLNNSNVDTSITASMKYFNKLDTLGDLPEMTAARETIKDLKNQAVTNQISETDAKNLIDNVKTKMAAYKRCHIWAGSAPAEEKASQYKEHDCTSKRNELIDFVMKVRSK